MLLTLFESIQSGDFRMTLILLLLSLPIIMFSLSVHESAHGLVAYKCGDPTARNLGRISLNPAKHFDPLGFLCMFVFGFGWANPVPINTRNFRDPKKGMAITAAAGPLSNLLLGLIFTALTALSFTCFRSAVGIPETNFALYMFKSNDVPFWWYILLALYYFFYLGAIMNFTLMIFNMIPIPPFDGSRILTVFLPTNLYFRIMKYERQIMIGFLIAIFVLSRFFGISIAGSLPEWLFQLLFKPFSMLFSLIF